MILATCFFFSLSCTAGWLYCAVQHYCVTVATKVVIAASVTKPSGCPTMFTSQLTIWALWTLTQSVGEMFSDNPKISLNPNCYCWIFDWEFICATSVYITLFNKTKEENWTPAVESVACWYRPSIFKQNRTLQVQHVGLWLYSNELHLQFYNTACHKHIRCPRTYFYSCDTGQTQLTEPPVSSTSEVVFFFFFPTNLVSTFSRLLKTRQDVNILHHAV